MYTIFSKSIRRWAINLNFQKTFTWNFLVIAAYALIGLESRL